MFLHTLGRNVKTEEFKQNLAEKMISKKGEIDTKDFFEALLDTHREVTKQSVFEKLPEAFQKVLDAIVKVLRGINKEDLPSANVSISEKLVEQINEMEGKEVDQTHSQGEVAAAAKPKLREVPKPPALTIAGNILQQMDNQKEASTGVDGGHGMGG